MCPSTDDHHDPTSALGIEADPDERPIAVETFVRVESGEWLVDIAVAFPDRVVRRTVNKYRTERHADIAASWIRRAASRDIEGPPHG